MKECVGEVWGLIPNTTTGVGLGREREAKQNHSKLYILNKHNKVS